MAVAASTHQADMKLLISGRQCTCNVLMAFIKHNTERCVLWTSYDLAEILTKGDELYQNTIEMQENRAEYLLVDELPKHVEC